MTCKWQVVVKRDPGQKWPKPGEVWCLIWNDLFVSLEEWEVIQIRKTSTADGTSCQSVLAITLERARTWAKLLRERIAAIYLLACLSSGEGRKGKSVLWGKTKVHECSKRMHCMLLKKKVNFFWPDFQFLFFLPCTLGPLFVFIFF